MSRVCLLLLLVALVSVCIASEITCYYEGDGCKGSCPNESTDGDDLFCIEYLPHRCKYLACAYDYATNDCMGQCPKLFFGRTPSCVLVSNDTMPVCECE
ncbi:hypothetical protein KIPB_009180 [Kipferlia bialata]|uniref:Uncharacterized protein n=1 Tax=Kipferlia bialata TaxID=797122 RepID=A0A391NN35_9EUKA|nr:hypothetical protein KIPB_006137 [Kipferlia bialata]GCA63075.1 hypothetical protein KIPB_007695 [Kipferlia bialata]GCA63312.1 hypothetical protein KIPB_009180 [Kipferlia bialata]|eukprot:g6137.t1